jgi:hypothetical protein
VHEAMTPGQVNLRAMLERADAIDYREGLAAYGRYHETMRAFAIHYGFNLDVVTAAFVSLSPNNDYKGNLRSLASVLAGVQDGTPDNDIVISTYNHCKHRALAYVRGQAKFLDLTRGPKIKNFYFNILDPFDVRWVTIDGHMSAIWQGLNLTMREALIPSRVYEEIKGDVQRLAFSEFITPCQLQAILWFTRKRIARVVYDPQHDLFVPHDDTWRTYQDPTKVMPYPRKNADDRGTRGDVEAQALQESERSAGLFTAETSCDPG